MRSSHISDNPGSFFSNPARLSTFKSDNQVLWAKGCMKAHEILEEELATFNTTLLNIYNQLAQLRKQIAIQQLRNAQSMHNEKFEKERHTPPTPEEIESQQDLENRIKDINRFGKVHDNGYGYDDFNYENNQYYHGEGDFEQDAFMKMSEILLQQENSFGKEVRGNITKFYYPSSEGKFKIDFEKNQHSQITRIEAKGEFVNQEIYERKMMELHERYLEKIKQSPQMSQDEFLSELAKLSYELSRFYPLKRGSNAVNEWIIQGMAKTFKNISLGHIAIDGLSFDLYAFVQQDINKYVQKFVESVHEKLDSQPNPKLNIK